jgi:hypothetical protein
MTSSDKALEQLVSRLRLDYPEFKFRSSKQTHWSPHYKTIFFNSAEATERLKSGVLHELAHGILGHDNYSSDFELLKLESEAWALAAKLGVNYQISISEDYIQQCLDTYRDWLHRRSTCPVCGTHVMQKDSKNYQCYNCQTGWQVSGARFLRPYRRSINKTKTH